jgi:hypothetical protein
MVECYRSHWSESCTAKEYCASTGTQAKESLAFEVPASDRAALLLGVLFVAASANAMLVNAWC